MEILTSWNFFYYTAFKIVLKSRNKNASGRQQSNLFKNKRLRGKQMLQFGYFLETTLVSKLRLIITTIKDFLNRIQLKRSLAVIHTSVKETYFLFSTRTLLCMSEWYDLQDYSPDWWCPPDSVKYLVSKVRQHQQSVCAKPRMQSSKLCILPSPTTTCYIIGNGLREIKRAFTIASMTCWQHIRCNHEI